MWEGVQHAGVGVVEPDASPENFVAHLTTASSDWDGGVQVTEGDEVVGK